MSKTTNVTTTRYLAKRRRPSRSRAAMLPAIVMATLTLGGCGYGDIELNGPIFDVIGLNSTAPKKTATVERRSGLVTPPSLERLPPPGGTVQPQDSLASLNDPDRKVELSAEELARQQKAYCEKHYEPARARGDYSADSIEGPTGPCRKSVLSVMKHINGQ